MQEHSHPLQLLVQRWIDFQILIWAALSEPLYLSRFI
jgi:hypothetical protein